MVASKQGNILKLRDNAKETVTASLERIRGNPFVVEAHAQTLTKEQAERWIMCAGRESRSFPSILENLVARSTNERVKQILAENLGDEYGNGNPEEAHFKHYLQLLDNLKIPRERFNAYEERAGIQLALSLAYNISMQESEAVAIGYMLVNEDMTQITYAAARSALLPYHPDMDTYFFDLHVEVDEKHVEELYAAVDELRPDQAGELLFGISVGERGMAVLLDEAYGLFDYCTKIPAYEPVG